MQMAGAAAHPLIVLPGGFRPFQREALDHSLTDRFRAVAAAFPAHVAVESATRSMTYEELDAESARVAAVLAARSGRGDVIGVLLEHEPQLLVGVLGVLGAGAAYVPLDPKNPIGRLQHIARDAGLRIIVSDHGHRGLAEEIVGAGNVVDVSTRTSEAVHESPAEPSGIAYVYYTTGTTGLPKGVLDSHRNVLHNIMRYTNRLAISPEDRLTLLQRPGFSGAVSSMFGALLNGATACMYDVSGAGAGGIGRWLEATGVTMFHSVPVLFRQAARGGEADLSRIRVVRLEGDTASVADVALFRSRLATGSVLANGLGATECGLVRQLLVGHDEPFDRPTVPVGYAIEDMEVSLVGEDGSPAATGEVGEIAVTSAFIAGGYWGDPRATASRFFEAGDGARTFMTGDLGRMAEDGCLEHLGRRDFQVKVRGNRVEVESIESLLCRSGLAAQAAVGVTGEDRAGEAELVACVVPASEPPPTVSALRAVLAGELPPWSIPARYAIVDELPLNENGKVDLSGLPRGRRPRPELDVPYLPPEAPLQAELVRVWEDVLDVSPVGRDDPFEELGGDSLLAATLLGELSDLVGEELPFSVVVTSRTVMELSEAILAHDPFVDDSVVQLEHGNDVLAPVFWVHGDFTGGGLYCRRLAARLAPRPFYSVMPHGFRGTPIPGSIEAMAADLVPAIESASSHRRCIVGGHCNLGGRVALEIVRLLEGSGRSASLVLVGAVPAPVDVRLLRAFRRAVHVLALPRRLDEERERAVYLGLRQRLLALVHRGADRQTTPEWEAWNRALDAYVPADFRRPVTLLWPTHERYDAGTASHRWRAIGAEPSTVVVPGDHLTVVTTYLDELAAVLRTELDAIDRPPVPGDGEVDVGESSATSSARDVGS